MGVEKKSLDSWTYLLLSYCCRLFFFFFACYERVFWRNGVGVCVCVVWIGWLLKKKNETVLFSFLSLFCFFSISFLFWGAKGQIGPSPTFQYSLDSGQNWILGVFEDIPILLDWPFKQLFYQLDSEEFHHAKINLH